MKLWSYVLVFLVMLPIAVAQNTGEAQIRAAREESNQALAQHDVQSFARTLSDDFVMIRGSGAFVASKQSYIDLFKGDFANPNAIRYRRTPTSIEVSTAAPLAAEHGDWIGLNPDGSIAYRGTYMAMWRRTGIHWQIRSELFVILSCGKGEACSSYTQPAH